LKLVRELRLEMSYPIFEAGETRPCCGANAVAALLAADSARGRGGVLGGGLGLRSFERAFRTLETGAKLEGASRTYVEDPSGYYTEAASGLSRQVG
jgi:hypothetical protein